MLHFNFIFIKMDISNAALVHELFTQHNFLQVIHFGCASAGVRYSIQNPYMLICKVIW